MRATLSTYDDKAVLEECERGEDNALARYRKALQKPLPASAKIATNGTRPRPCEALTA